MRASTAFLPRWKGAGVGLTAVVREGRLSAVATIRFDQCRPGGFRPYRRGLRTCAIPPFPAVRQIVALRPKHALPNRGPYGRSDEATNRA
jgi:hypothetical protein